MKLLRILLNITYYIFIVSFIILIPFLFLIRFDGIPELTKYFSIENSKYIKYIGWLLIFIYIIEHILSEHLITILSSTNFFIWLDNFNIIEFLLIMFFKLIIGMLLLSIGKAFELGLKQKQENELTI